MELMKQTTYQLNKIEHPLWERILIALIGSEFKLFIVFFIILYLVSRSFWLSFLLPLISIAINKIFNIID
jgi:hypothetical protein